jgi:hypothetical protein
MPVTAFHHIFSKEVIKKSVYKIVRTTRLFYYHDEIDTPGIPAVLWDHFNTIRLVPVVGEIPY